MKGLLLTSTALLAFSVASSAAMIDHEAVVDIHQQSTNAPVLTDPVRFGFTSGTQVENIINAYLQVGDTRYEQTGPVDFTWEIETLGDPDSPGSYILAGNIPMGGFNLHQPGDTWIGREHGDTTPYQGIARGDAVWRFTFVHEDNGYYALTNQWTRTVHEVPAPAPLGLMALGLAGLALKRRINHSM